jgi:hypothetical protein
MRSPYTVFSALLIAAAAAAAFAIAAWHEMRLSRALADDDLRDLRAMHRVVERQHGRETALRAEMIAGNQAVTGYIGQALDGALPGIEPDYTSVVDLLEERRAQLGLSMVAILGADGQVLASTDRLTGPLSFGDSPLFRDVRESKLARGGLLVEGERLMDMLVLPLAEYGFSEIYLLVASPVDQRFVQAIVDSVGGDTGVAAADKPAAGKSGVDVAIVAQGPQGDRIAATTLDAKRAAALPLTPPANAAAPFTLDIGGVPRAVVSVPLFGDAKARVLLLSSPDSGSVARAAARLPLLVGIALTLLALLVALWWIRRRWWAPFDALSRLVIYAADSGDLHLKAPVAGVAPVARLADAFNRLCARAAAAIQKP